MNKLDRRFLDYTTCVLGWDNTPDEDCIAGDAYIVGSSPSGAFERATPNSIARYDGTNWKFSMPTHNDLVFNLSDDEILIYEVETEDTTGGWLQFINRKFSTVRCANFVKSGTSLPATCHYDPEHYTTDVFLNTSTGEIKVATAENTWGQPDDVEFFENIDTFGHINIDVESRKAYTYDNGGYVETDYGTCGLYIDTARNNRLCYLHDNKLGSDQLIQLWPFYSSISNAEYETTTETHTVTADEVTTKRFTLSNSVASGKESNVLCFVQGLAQPVNTAFTVSGDSFSWDGKSLDGNVNTGDVFIVQYVKSAD